MNRITAGTNPAQMINVWYVRSASPRNGAYKPRKHESMDQFFVTVPEYYPSVSVFWASPSLPDPARNSIKLNGGVYVHAVKNTLNALGAKVRYGKIFNSHCLNRLSDRVRVRSLFTQRSNSPCIIPLEASCRG